MKMIELETCLNLSIECDARARHKSELKELLNKYFEGHDKIENTPVDYCNKDVT